MEQQRHSQTKDFVANKEPARGERVATNMRTDELLRFVTACRRDGSPEALALAQKARTALLHSWGF
jgi:hypothetical protein